MPEVIQVLVYIVIGHQYVTKVCKAERKATQNLIDEITGKFEQHSSGRKASEQTQKDLYQKSQATGAVCHKRIDGSTGVLGCWSPSAPGLGVFPTSCREKHT